MAEATSTLNCVKCGQPVPVYGNKLRSACPFCRSRQWWMREVPPVQWRLTDKDAIYLKVERIVVEPEDLPGWTTEDLYGPEQGSLSCPRTTGLVRVDRRARFGPSDVIRNHSRRDRRR